MKKLSKFLSMILALALAFALAVPAFADSVNGYTDPAAEEVEFSVAPIGVATISYFFGDEARTVTAYVFDQDCAVTRKDGLALTWFNMPLGQAGGPIDEGYVAGISADATVYQFGTEDDWTFTNGWSPCMVSKAAVDEMIAEGTKVEYRPLSAQTAQPGVKPARGQSVALNDGSGQFAYTIKYGDTLSGLAHYYYGNMNVYKLIYELNKDTIKNPNMIYAGQTIILPSYPAAAAYPAK